MGKVPAQASQLLFKREQDAIYGPGVVIIDQQRDTEFHFSLPPGQVELSPRLSLVVVDWFKEQLMGYTWWLLGMGGSDFFDDLLDRLPPPDDDDGHAEPLPKPKGPHGQAKEKQQSENARYN